MLGPPLTQRLYFGVRKGGADGLADLSLGVGDDDTRLLLGTTAELRRAQAHQEADLARPRPRPPVIPRIQSWVAVGEAAAPDKPASVAASGSGGMGLAVFGGGSANGSAFC